MKLKCNREHLLQTVNQTEERISNHEVRDFEITQGASLVAQMVKYLPAFQETRVQPLGPKDFPGKGNGYALQYSCLENSMERGTWQATVQVVTKSWT